MNSIHTPMARERDSEGRLVAIIVCLIGGHPGGINHDVYSLVRRHDIFGEISPLRSRSYIERLVLNVIICKNWLRLLDVYGDDNSAFPRQRLGGGLTDAAISPGNKSNLSFDSHGSAPCHTAPRAGPAPSGNEGVRPLRQRDT